LTRKIFPCYTSAHARKSRRILAVLRIGAFDVATHLGVSRRLADLRFRQMTGISILEAILDRRFDELKRHLRDSDVPIEKLIKACGFRTMGNAKNLFKKRYGVSMREYRHATAHAALCKLEL